MCRAGISSGLQQAGLWFSPPSKWQPVWPPSHAGTRVSLEKCHPSSHGVYNYTDGAQEITDEVEMAQV